MLVLEEEPSPFDAEAPNPFLGDVDSTPVTWSEDGDWLTPALASNTHWSFSVRLDYAAEARAPANTYLVDPAVWGSRWRAIRAKSRAPAPTLNSGMTRERTGGEKQVLAEFLDQQLEVIRWKLERLSDDQLRRAATPSGVCILALAKHVAGVAYYWLCEVFGRPFEPWPGTETDDIELDPNDTTVGVLRYYDGARTASASAIRELDLNATGTTWLGDVVSFRWAILHTIEEAARHAGHVDLMRERIDNTTGHLPPRALPY